MTTMTTKTIMTTTDNDNITIDEHIKYLEEKRDAFNRLLIAMQEDAGNKKQDIRNRMQDAGNKKQDTKL